MTPAGGQRRTLGFENLSQVMPEVQRLQITHRTLGRWTLGQICCHLAMSFDGSIDGLDLRRHRIKRCLIPKLMLWYTFRYGIPANYTVDPNIEPTSEVDLTRGVEELRRAVERYRAHEGVLYAHPLFGRMPRVDWDRLHLFHSAHHLSYVLPAARA